jgi:preprotein translocase SecE subunit
MKAKKSLILFLVSCLCLTLCFALGVGAEDGAANKMDTFTLVSLIIAGVVLVGVVVLCIVKRVKLMEALRAYKSEMKKITWFPWKAVWRSTVLVLVVVVAVAVLVGLLDLVFFEGQYALVGIGK